MPKISAKRQITLPIKQCRLAGIEPGDEYESYIDNNGYITIVKKIKGVAKGILENIKADPRYGDEQSLETGLAGK